MCSGHVQQGGGREGERANERDIERRHERRGWGVISKPQTIFEMEFDSQLSFQAIVNWLCAALSKPQFVRIWSR